MLVIAGIILLGVGAYLLYSRKQSLNTVMDVKYHETSKVSEVLDTYQHIKAELGEGNYSGNMVELIGIGKAKEPLSAEHSQRAAIYYEAQVVREYEVTVERRDEDGNLTRNVERRSETVSNNSQYVPFYLDDGSGGQVLVDLEKAKLDTIESYDKFEQNAPSGFNISFGSESRTLGYRYKERMIPDGAKLYILGEISDRRGELAIIKPEEKDKPFIVSTKSQEEIIKSGESSAKWSLVGAIALAIIGVALIIAYFL